MPLKEGSHALGVGVFAAGPSRARRAGSHCPCGRIRLGTALEPLRPLDALLRVLGHALGQVAGGGRARTAREGRIALCSTSWPSARRRPAVASGLLALTSAVHTRVGERPRLVRQRPRAGGPGRARTSRAGRRRPRRCSSAARCPLPLRASKPTTLMPYQCSFEAEQAGCGRGWASTRPAAAVGRRDADRAGPVRSGGRGAQARRHGGRAASARAARAAIGVPGVAGDAEGRTLGVSHDHQLGTVRLADHHGARSAQSPHPARCRCRAGREVRRGAPGGSPRRSRPRRPSPPIGTPSKRPVVACAPAPVRLAARRRARALT